MAEHEYYEVNGRQIRVRPTESGQEIDEYGNFHRQPNHFTKGFGEGENPVEADRYILFWGKGCNWSNRASIARELLGLDKVIKVEIVDWGDYEKPLGWEFVNSPNHINKETGAQFLSELYYNADDDYEGRTTVPALVDYKEKKVVNNDYHHLTNHFETAFKPFHKKGAPDLYPEELREEIDKLNVWLFENVNNAVYRAQFAESLQAFKDGYETFFAGLEAMDKRLENQRFLFGDYITDSDIRLYTTLARFDYSYSRNIGPCVAMIVSLILGLILALIKMKKIPVLKQIANLYISVIRGTPVLVQLYVTYFGIPMILKAINLKYGTNYNANGVAPIIYAFIALAVNESAYNAEVIRASLESVPKGQIEAANALGMTYFQALRRVILPEAIVVALPSLGNSFIGLIKGTSLAFVCAVVEMTAAGKIIAGRTYRYFEVYVSLAIIYWIITIIVEQGIKLIEKKIRIPENAPAIQTDEGALNQ